MKKIIIVGAGKYGAKALQLYGADNIGYFADNLKELQGTLYLDKLVIPVDSLARYASDYIIVIAIEKFQSVIQQMETMNILQYIVFCAPHKSRINRIEIEKNILYAPTCVKKIGEFFFVVDCWHHRVIYSNEIEGMPTAWEILDDGLQNPHSIASDYENKYYLTENTEKDAINIYIREHSRFEKVQTIEHLGYRPHKIIYDKKNGDFLVLLSVGIKIALIKCTEGKACVERIVELEGIEGYSRSIKVINDILYLVTGEGVIYELEYVNRTFAILNQYQMCEDFWSLNDVEFWEGEWYLSSYLDKAGNITPRLIRFKSFEDACANRYENIGIKYGFKGVPYFMEIIENQMYLTEIDRCSCISKLKKEDNGMLSREILYENSIITDDDFYKRYLWEE